MTSPLNDPFLLHKLLVTVYLLGVLVVAIMLDEGLRRGQIPLPKELRGRLADPDVQRTLTWFCLVAGVMWPLLLAYVLWEAGRPPKDDDRQ